MSENSSQICGKFQTPLNDIMALGILKSVPVSPTTLVDDLIHSIIDSLLPFIKSFANILNGNFPYGSTTHSLPLSEAFANEMCSHVRCMLVILCMKKNSIHTFSALWFNAAEWLFFLRQCFYVCKKLIILLPDVIISFFINKLTSVIWHFFKINFWKYFARHLPPL